MKSIVSKLRKLIIASIVRVGHIIPAKLRRRIADFPGILYCLEKLSNSALVEMRTPEGHILVINPLFHSTLIRSGDLRGYEPDIRKIIMKFTKPGMAAYDIGANVGVFSFLFASIVGNSGIVYSFEPEENNYRCFEKSLEKNSNNTIVLDSRAVGNTQSTERFDRRGGAFSGRLVGKGDYNTTQNIRTVETVSIDHVVTVEGYRVPDIIKIDVEGNEGMVLEGMKNILGSHNPIIICELHTHLGESSARVINLLSGSGYTVSGVREALAGIDPGNRKTTTPLEGHIIAVKTPGKS